MPSLARPPMPFMWPIVYTGTTGYEFLKEVAGIIQLHMQKKRNHSSRSLACHAQGRTSKE